MINLECIILLRKERGLTQSQVGEVLGIKLRQYQRYEHGENELGINDCITLADFYDVSLDYLVGRSDRRERT